MSPVGPPPTITTACLVIATLRSFPRRRSTRPRATGTSTTLRSFRDSVGSGFGRRFYGMTRVLKQAPYAPHIKVGIWVFCLPVICAVEIVRWAKARERHTNHDNLRKSCGGHAQPVIGRASARPAGFAHPCLLARNSVAREESDQQAKPEHREEISGERPSRELRYASDLRQRHHHVIHHHE